MKDFDEFFKELDAQEKGIEIKLYGKVYSLPCSIPAEMYVKAMRGSAGGTLSDSETMKLGIKMLGEENVNEWCEKGISIKQLSEIVVWYCAEVTQAQLGENQSEELAEKKDQTP